MHTSTERKVPFSSCGMERKEMFQTRGQTELGSHPAFAQGLSTTASEHPLSDSVSLGKLPSLGGPPCSHFKWACKGDRSGTLLWVRCLAKYLPQNNGSISDTISI